ncbi:MULTISPECIES: oligopeptide ABC transporter substrate-binding protein [unclassified Granulicatella]|uniref:oligopeptide ABC transporter substrate-binding protein n=1 Tax=unclassified Granulicatella TaxID=2630493 RepID=UPI001073F0E8|nr:MULTISPECIES: oligopeptide ABC transporter substrate-binding protein [unclassified Granulicatella]MBF0779638.1 oligopeptide ABC transporter substrate-binding protein [Granulicatella sp. 19428wC4_WM01]TFU96296.1 oligopeptide ABC transporter substrate-binding protein [Granulicatella sp. WM01]
MNKKAKWFLGLAATVLLAACGNNQDNASKDGASDNTANSETLKSNFPLKVENEGTAIKGGILKYALVSESPFDGLLNANYYEASPDSEVIQFLDESLFIYDDNQRITDKGMGKLEYDIDKKTVTVTIKEGLKWSDGHDFKIDDYIYAFEVIGHKDYTGTRYSSVKDIVGMEDYHAGKAESISGIKKNSDYSVTFELTEMTPDVIQGGGFWSSALPKHIFGNIPVAQQAASDAVRKNPVGLGAFRLKSIVAGESVTLEANEYYWQGKPKLEGVIVSVVNSNSAADEFKKGEYDIITVPTTKEKYEAFKELDNVEFLGRWNNVITYLGFKTGTWDKEAEKVAYNPEAKMSNKSLRQAMSYALNVDEFSQSFYGDLRVRANSLIVPTFKDLRDSTVPGYAYDKEKAIKLLDEAGYKDVDGDGLREDPKGQKLTIQLGFMSSADSDTQANYYIQQWKEVGLDVQLTNGRTIEFKSFYKLVQGDDPSIDIYVAAWSVGGNPNPNRLWGDTANNYSRFMTKEYSDILSKFDSKDMFDREKQVAAFKEWQKFAQEEVFTLPLQFRTVVIGVNKRVKSFDVSFGDKNWGNHLHKLELLADQPIKSTK